MLNYITKYHIDLWIWKLSNVSTVRSICISVEADYFTKFHRIVADFIN